MARRPGRPSGPISSSDGAPISPPPGPASASPLASNRDRIITAFLQLAAERSFDEIDFDDIATRSGVSLADCREEFASVLEVLSAFLKDVDRKVLAGSDPDMAEEPARERLFDVLMRRLELLAPHKDAIRSLVESGMRRPSLALALGSLANRSQRWMLIAAGIDTAGTRGALRTQGLSVLYGRVLRVWLRDDDPGLARTMAALDEQLSRGARWARFLDDLCRFVPGRAFRHRSRRREPLRPETEDPASGAIGI